MISIQRVPKTKSIIVFGETENISDEYINLYFENKKNGGGEVAGLSRNEDGIVVTFMDHKGKYMFMT